MIPYHHPAKHYKTYFVSSRFPFMSRRGIESCQCSNRPPYGNSLFLLHWISIWSPGHKSLRQSEIWSSWAEVLTGGALSLFHSTSSSVTTVRLPCGGYLWVKIVYIIIQEQETSTNPIAQVKDCTSSSKKVQDKVSMVPGRVSWIWTFTEDLNSTLALCYNLEFCSFNVFASKQKILSIPCIKSICTAIITDFGIIAW